MWNVTSLIRNGALQFPVVESRAEKERKIMEKRTLSQIAERLSAEMDVAETRLIDLKRVIMDASDENAIYLVGARVSDALRNLTIDTYRLLTSGYKFDDGSYQKIIILIKEAQGIFTSRASLVGPALRTELELEYLTRHLQE